MINTLTNFLRRIKKNLSYEGRIGDYSYQGYHLSGRNVVRKHYRSLYGFSSKVECQACCERLAAE